MISRWSVDTRTRYQSLYRSFLVCFFPHSFLAFKGISLAFVLAVLPLAFSAKPSVTLKLFPPCHLCSPWSCRPHLMEGLPRHLASHYSTSLALEDFAAFSKIAPRVVPTASLNKAISEVLPCHQTALQTRRISIWPASSRLPLPTNCISVVLDLNSLNGAPFFVPQFQINCWLASSIRCYSY